MDRNRLGLALVVAIILGAPAVIIGLAVAAYPFLVVPALIAATFVWIGSLVVGWLLVQIGELRSEVADLKDQALAVPSSAPPPPGAGWEDVVNLKLILEGGEWKATSSFKVDAGRRVRVTANARSRFVLHLATNVLDDAPVRKRSFHSIERTPEATEVTRTFEVPKAGTYAVVLVPAGISTFRAEVKVEREADPVHPSF